MDKRTNALEAISKETIDLVNIIEINQMYQCLIIIVLLQRELSR